MSAPRAAGVPLRAGYLVHREKSGKNTYTAVVEQTPGSLPAASFIPMHECAVSLADAMARAASMCDRYQGCTYQGDLTEALDATAT